MKPILSLYETQSSIGLVKRYFEDALATKLNLKRVSAPLFVNPNTGLNDNLSGIERPVSFDIPRANACAEVVHSLAKWKRLALKKYQFSHGEGLYTDMNAIRRDDDMDNIHSIYVDQWDWEKVMLKEERTVEYLKDTVQKIVDAICDTSEMLKGIFPELSVSLNREVKFITSQELFDLYPSLTPKQREYEIVKKHGTVFIMQIGKILKDGSKHDMRAPDYDDWELNGDIFFYHKPLDIALELSSMGIRVDEESMDRQLTLAGCNDRRELEFHKMLLSSQLPYTIGGGIGQSRLCMLLMEKMHIGEVQVSVWDQKNIDYCKEHNLELL
ncbi:MAG: aspartate--ammonia ligase [Clostridiales bacterium]|nr:aspartate--ammonia ligase [Clostridiales bacterium]